MVAIQYIQFLLIIFFNVIKIVQLICVICVKVYTGQIAVDDQYIDFLKPLLVMCI